MPTALVTGISAQDGSYLTELLLANGYEVTKANRELSWKPKTSFEELVTMMLDADLAAG